MFSVINSNHIENVPKSLTKQNSNKTQNRSINTTFNDLIKERGYKSNNSFNVTNSRNNNTSKSKIFKEISIYS